MALNLADLDYGCVANCRRGPGPVDILFAANMAAAFAGTRARAAAKAARASEARSQHNSCRILWQHSRKTVDMLSVHSLRRLNFNSSFTTRAIRREPSAHGGISRPSGLDVPRCGVVEISDLERYREDPHGIYARMTRTNRGEIASQAERK